MVLVREYGRWSGCSLHVDSLCGILRTVLPAAVDIAKDHAQKKVRCDLTLAVSFLRGGWSREAWIPSAVPPLDELQLLEGPDHPCSDLEQGGLGLSLGSPHTNLDLG